LSLSKKPARCDGCNRDGSCPGPPVCFNDGARSARLAKRGPAFPAQENAPAPCLFDACDCPERGSYYCEAICKFGRFVSNDTQQS